MDNLLHSVYELNVTLLNVTFGNDVSLMIIVLVGMWAAKKNDQ